MDGRAQQPRAPGGLAGTHWRCSLSSSSSCCIACPRPPHRGVRAAWQSRFELHDQVRRGDLHGCAHPRRSDGVWARLDGERLVVARRVPSSSIEGAGHRRRTLGHPMIDDTRYPPRAAGRLMRCPRPTDAAEAARLPLIEALTADVSPIETKMPQAVALARWHCQMRVRDPRTIGVGTRGGPRSCGGLLGVGGGGGIEWCRFPGDRCPVVSLLVSC